MVAFSIQNLIDLESDNSFDRRSFFEMVEKNISEKDTPGNELKNESKNILKTLKDDPASAPGNINNQILYSFLESKGFICKEQ
ncbi:hypothetical protein BpHYR1_048249 [Brachionus plicatilis]|uniref:Uncharacterized protein n=1 Tax=Brachionus plicatilis TaxID=10195 RepID=A0A3M7PA36_BRAPC|nr:hypothetical protein BpHYR1_048249 [Brachionus plicatilis]